ncbi:hypothetical protein [Brevibacillus sp. NRS-1366]|uniref:hypothetical protein n=1 Tax=Brevibacillus sp. NRS-1366 TaxID=3233899 RepID=UPI003D1C053F
MRNSEIKQVTRHEEITHSITCNKCGNTHFPDDEGEYRYIHKIDIRFDGDYNNYRSKCWWIDLCDDCLIDMVKELKYAPDWFKGSRSEHAQAEFEKWVEDGCKPMSRFDSKEVSV